MELGVFLSELKYNQFCWCFPFGPGLKQWSKNLTLFQGNSKGSCLLSNVTENISGAPLSSGSSSEWPNQTSNRWFELCSRHLASCLLWCDLQHQERADSLLHWGILFHLLSAASTADVYLSFWLFSPFFHLLFFFPR